MHFHIKKNTAALCNLAQSEEPQKKRNLRLNKLTTTKKICLKLKSAFFPCDKYYVVDDDGDSRLKKKIRATKAKEKRSVRAKKANSKQPAATMKREKRQVQSHQFQCMNYFHNASFDLTFGTFFLFFHHLILLLLLQLLSFI